MERKRILNAIHTSSRLLPLRRPKGSNSPTGAREPGRPKAKASLSGAQPLMVSTAGAAGAAAFLPRFEKGFFD